MNTNLKRLAIAVALVVIVLAVMAIPSVFANPSHLVSDFSASPTDSVTFGGWTAGVGCGFAGCPGNDPVYFELAGSSATATFTTADVHTTFSFVAAVDTTCGDLAWAASGGASPAAGTFVCSAPNTTMNFSATVPGGFTSFTLTLPGTAGVYVIDDVSISGAVAAGGGGGAAVPFVCDTRINCFPGTMVPIYCQEDAVEIWTIGYTTGVGELAIRVPYADLLLLPEFPASNMTIATQEDIGFYKLTTGELQVNRGPDFEGKVYVFIWNGCPISNGYIRSFNIFDLFVESTP